MYPMCEVAGRGSGGKKEEIMERKYNLHKSDKIIPKGVVCYACQLLAPVEGFGPLPRIFLPFAPKSDFNAVFAL